MFHRRDQLDEKRMTSGWLLARRKSGNAFEDLQRRLLPSLGRLCTKRRLRPYTVHLVRASTNDDHLEALLARVVSSPFHVRHIDAVAAAVVPLLLI